MTVHWGGKCEKCGRGIPSGRTGDKVCKTCRENAGGGKRK